MSEFIKRGKLYYCPYGCGDSRFPSPKWKTEKGAQKHVDNCGMRPEKVEERKAKESAKIEKLRKAADEQKVFDDAKLKTAKYSIGDLISFVLIVSFIGFSP